MRYPRARPTLRDGLVATLAISTLLLALQALHVARHATGISPQVSYALSIGFFVLVALITLAVRLPGAGLADATN